MRKIRYIPEDKDRIEQKEEERKARRAAFNEPVTEDAAPTHEIPDEVRSLDEFASYLIDEEDRQTYNHLELREMCARSQLSSVKVHAVLSSYGLMPEPREKPRTVRGFNSNNHDLYTHIR